MAVLETAIRTAIYGSSIHTFSRGLKLPYMAVLWSRRQTADLGSFMAALQWCDPGMPQTADLGSSMAALGRWHNLKILFVTQTASLGSLMVTLEHGSSNCRPRQFYGRFTVMQNLMPSNCRPWQFHGRFREMTKTVHKTASLGSFVGSAFFSDNGAQYQF